MSVVMMSHTIGIITSYTNMMGCNDQPAMLDNIVQIMQECGRKLLNAPQFMLGSCASLGLG